jgi:hypothetical protein
VRQTTQIVIESTKMIQEELDLRAKSLRIRHYLSVENWKTVCVAKGGLKHFQMLLSDPTGVSQKLIAYQKIAPWSGTYVFKKKVCLGELQKVLRERLKDCKWNTPFWQYINEVQNAVSAELTRLMYDLMEDMLAGKDSLHLQDFRTFCESTMYSPAELEFVLEVQESIKRIKIKPDSLLAEQGKLIDTFEIRNTTDSKLNVSDEERKKWVKALDDGKAKDCEAILESIAKAVRTQIIGEHMPKFWATLKR